MTTLDPLSLTTRLMRHETPFSSRVQGEVVMMSLETNNYYGLGQVGSRIWELLAQPTDLATVVSALQQEFRVDAETCLCDVTDFVQALLREGLVILVP